MSSERLGADGEGPIEVKVLQGDPDRLTLQEKVQLMALWEKYLGGFPDDSIKWKATLPMIEAEDDS